MDQLVSPKNPQCDIHKTHHCTTEESFHNYKYYYECGMMILYIFSAVKPEGVTYASAVHNIHGRWLLNDGYCMFMLDRRDLRHFIKTLRDEHVIGWAAYSMSMHFAFLVDGSAISPAQAIIISQATNISSKILWFELKFKNTVQSLLSFV